MRALLILACFIAATEECIPTKTPTPGIPAMPPATKQCPPWKIADPDVCMRSGSPPCSLDAIITATTITCPAPKKVSFVEAGFVGFMAVSAKCTDGVWYGDRGGGNPLVPLTPPFVTNPTIACWAP